MLPAVPGQVLEQEPLELQAPAGHIVLPSLRDQLLGRGVHGRAHDLAHPGAAERGLQVWVQAKLHGGRCFPLRWRAAPKVKGAHGLP